MGKSKASGTGVGYLGETMVHKISGTVGVVEHVVEAKSGWPPEITLKRPDGSLLKGRLSDFREARAAEKKTTPILDSLQRGGAGVGGGLIRPGSKGAIPGVDGRITPGSYAGFPGAVGRILAGS